MRSDDPLVNKVVFFIHRPYQVQHVEMRGGFEFASLLAATNAGAPL